jgi:hypothetical protein
MTIIAPVCARCRHFDRDRRDADVCEAFPNGIPDEIWKGEDDHSEPFPGDHGIQFEPIDEEAE